MTSPAMKATLLGAVTFLTFAGSAFAGPTVDVLHWWTSGGESKAMLELKKEFQAAGGTWIDSAVAGGGGDAAATVLRSRVLAGNPPSVVQMKGPTIKDWAGQGALNDIDDVAKSENWNNLLPPLLKDVVTYEDKYVAAPVNIHRINWIWANPQVLEKAGVVMPGEFTAAGKKPGVDFICAPTPGAQGYLLNTDSFVFFNVKNGGPDVAAGQKLFAKLLMGADFQELFNLYKGSIPARLGVKRDKFDACAIKSMDDLDLSIKNHSLEPSMAHEMATTGAVRGAILDVVTEHFNSDMASAAAATKLADAVAAAK